MVGSLACEGQRASLIAHQALEVCVFKQACGERMEGGNKTPAILVKMILLRHALEHPQPGVLQSLN